MTHCRFAVASLVSILFLSPPAWSLPEANQVLVEMGLAPDAAKRVLAGEFVSGDVAPVSDRDLSIGLAFLAKTSPAELSKQIIAGELIRADSNVKAHGEFKDTGSLKDLAALQLTTDAAKALAAAEAGSSLNLSTGEIAAFAATKGDAGLVVEQLQQMLLSRYRSYKASGLGGIPPYDRGGGKSSDPAADLRRASDAARGLKKYLPGFQKVLIDYPKATVPGMSETFHWLNYNMDGKTTFVLTHVMSAPDGDAAAVVQRQFYVSTGYNAEQAVAAFLPVQNGTVVVYANHTFTDQVAGFGGSMKRSIGRNMMESQLKALFEKVQTMVK
jgi:hypothetical protein